MIRAMTTKQDIYDFIKTQPLMVVSTLSQEGRSQSAVVGFKQADSAELVFRTTNRES